MRHVKKLFQLGIDLFFGWGAYTIIQHLGKGGTWWGALIPLGVTALIAEFLEIRVKVDSE